MGSLMTPVVITALLALWAYPRNVKSYGFFDIGFYGMVKIMYSLWLVTIVWLLWLVLWFVGNI